MHDLERYLAIADIHIDDALAKGKQPVLERMLSPDDKSQSPAIYTVLTQYIDDIIALQQSTYQDIQRRTAFLFPFFDTCSHVASAAVGAGIAYTVQTLGVVTAPTSLVVAAGVVGGIVFEFYTGAFYSVCRGTYLDFEQQRLDHRRDGYRAHARAQMHNPSLCTASRNLS